MIKYICVSILLCQVLCAADFDDQIIKTTFHVYTGRSEDKTLYEERIKRDTISKYSPRYGAMGAVAGLPLAVVGAIPCAYCASEHGKKKGERQAIKSIEENYDWIQEPLLDLAFRTTKGKETIYYMTISLRPKDIGIEGKWGGWRKKNKHSEKTYESQVLIDWQLGVTREERADIYNSIFLDKKIEEFADYFESRDRHFFSSSDVVKIRYEELRARGEEFRGELSSAKSIFEIVQSIEAMKNGGKFPLTSWSGNMKRARCHTAQNENILNATMFTCTLLSKIGAFKEIEYIPRLLHSYRINNTPVLRKPIVEKLKEDSEKLLGDLVNLPILLPAELEVPVMTIMEFS